MNENQIECFGLTFKNPTDDEIKECCDFINELVAKYERKDETGKVIHDRKVFPVTILKWSVVAPFDWILKEYNKWLPWLHLGGWHSTAKNTLGRLALAIWRIHDKSGHIISFNSANTEPRLGQVISQTTLPININEVHKLNDPRYEGLVNMIKNAVDDKNARGRFNKKRFDFIPSLSAVILTGNGLPPSDGGYRTKCRPITFTVEDMYERESEEAKTFRDWLNSNIKLLGTLGDFAQNYIMNKPETLKDKEWNDIGIEVLSEFYARAGIDIPDWINLMVEYSESVQTQDEIVLQLRGYFLNLINHTSNTYRPPRSITEDRRDVNDPFINPNLSLIGKLKLCCELNLIPFIRYNTHKKLGQVFYITPDIIQDLMKNKTLADAVGSLKGLADLLGFDYHNIKIGDSKKQTKVIVVQEAIMNDLLEYNMGEIEENQGNGSQNNESTVESKDNKSEGNDDTLFNTFDDSNSN